MAKRLDFKKLGQKGFSLLEVMIALTLFSIFIASYLVSQGYNVSDSALNEEQLMLQQLCEVKLNELYINPPKFTNVTASGIKETKKFEESEYSNYEYTVEIKKIELPDFGQLLGSKGNASDEMTEQSEDNDYYNDANKAQRNSSTEKMVFDTLKKNIERIIWQARITVTNKETKYSYALSTYLTNYNEQVQLQIGF
ncbi:MAG: type IV pilus modification PilV family protein [Bacteriovoracaceae bacterium]